MDNKLHFNRKTMVLFGDRMKQSMRKEQSVKRRPETVIEISDSPQENNLEM